VAEKQYIITEDFVREFNRIRTKLDGMSGPGVTNTPQAITVNAVQGEGDKQFPEKRDFFLVKVTKTSGADGDASNPCAYVYTVFALDGTTELGTSVAVIGPRPNGLTTAPAATSYAIACYDENGALKLWQTLEKPTDDSCS
jgi:hypothetical protein